MAALRYCVAIFNKLLKVYEDNKFQNNCMIQNWM